ncbi:hypothetical protein PTKU15_22240 [Paraburkholderia terrae]|nr:hypothetical protein PTKU15_22240 [Paraburkholderia terrae]
MRGASAAGAAAVGDGLSSHPVRVSTATTIPVTAIIFMVSLFAGIAAQWQLTSARNSFAKDASSKAGRHRPKWAEKTADHISHVQMRCSHT